MLTLKTNFTADVKYKFQKIKQRKAFDYFLILLNYNWEPPKIFYLTCPSVCLGKIL